MKTFHQAEDTVKFFSKNPAMVHGSQVQFNLSTTYTFSQVNSLIVLFLHTQICCPSLKLVLLFLKMENELYSLEFAYVFLLFNKEHILTNNHDYLAEMVYF